MYIRAESIKCITNRRSGPITVRESASSALGRGEKKLRGTASGLVCRIWAEQNINELFRTAQALAARLQNLETPSQRSSPRSLSPASHRLIMPSLHKDVKAQVDATRLPPILSLIQGSQLIKQGAEAVRPLVGGLNELQRADAAILPREQKVYKSMLFPQATTTPPAASTAEALPVLLKHRFPKHYRHPTLDAQLTRQRLTSEARALVRCLKAGVKVPGLRCVDLAQGVLGMEWVEGWSVREVLGGGQDGDELPDDEETETSEEESAEDIEEMLRRKGVDPGELCCSSIADLASVRSALIPCILSQTSCCYRLAPRSAKCTSPRSSTAT